jgi:hypothetical protein
MGRDDVKTRAQISEPRMLRAYINTYRRQRVYMNYSVLGGTKPQKRNVDENHALDAIGSLGNALFANPLKRTTVASNVSEKGPLLPRFFLYA